MSAPASVARPVPFRGRSLGRVLLAILMFAAAFALGWVGFHTVKGDGSQSLPTLQATRVSRGTIAQTVSFTGYVEPGQDLKINFPASDRVTKVYVTPGQQVKAGDPLIQLDPTSLQSKLRQAQDGVVQARGHLVDLLQTSAPADVQAAEQALVAAQASYDSATTNLQALQAGPTPSQMAAAQAAVAHASAALLSAQQATAGPTQAQISAAKQQVTKANGDLTNANLALQAAQQQEQNCYVPPIVVLPGSKQPTYQPAPIDCPSAQRNVQSAQVQVTNAKAEVQAANDALDALLNPSAATAAAQQAQLASAQADLASANAAVAALTQPPTAQQLQQTAAQISSAKSGVAAAQAKLQQLSAGPLAADLAAAQAAIDSAQVNVDDTQRSIAEDTIRAPFDGVVAAVNAVVGAVPPNNGEAVELVDLAHAQVVGAADEESVVQLHDGQPVQVTFDALPGQSFSGTVATVTPSGTNSQGVVTFPVTVSIVHPGVTLQSGLTANASVTVNSVADALTVPVRAVQRSAAGETVTVIDPSGAMHSVTVTTGISDGTNIQVLSGLTPGDLVLVTPLTGGTAQPSRIPNLIGPVGGVGGLGGIGGRGRR